MSEHSASQISAFGAACLQTGDPAEPWPPINKSSESVNAVTDWCLNVSGHLELVMVHLHDLHYEFILHKNSVIKQLKMGDV